jgi:hypothetical protein
MRRGFLITLLTGVFQIYLRPGTASTHVDMLRFYREEYKALEHLAVPFLIISRFHLLHIVLILIDTRVSLFSRSVRGGHFVLPFFTQHQLQGALLGIRRDGEIVVTAPDGIRVTLNVAFGVA